ncbi:MAG TPA: alpha/beta fold hydrolase [Mycobacteriales bacterium]|nr:alpha/beta fold hydrolase [Mycobacteriales bacterium]
MPLLPGAQPWRHDGGEVGVLVLHGFTDTPSSVQAWAEALAEGGFTVSVPRLPGHGTRWQDLAVTRWPDWYGEAERAFDELRARCRLVYVAALSMGGTLALRLAQQRGDQVAGLALVNPSIMDKRPLWLVPAIAWLVPAVPGIGGDIKKPGEPEASYRFTPLKAVASLAQLWKLTQADLPAVRQPVLLFHSRVDHVVHPVNSQILLERIGSTDVTEHVLEDSYHVATLDNDAPFIFSRSRAWITEHAELPAEPQAL